MILLRLFYEFFLTGLFSFGGGLATVPFLYDMSAKTGWFSSADLTNMIAVSESTPGPIGVNMATYVGFTTSGVLGAIVATMGLIAPSIIVILLIAKLLDKYRQNPIVNAAFYGLRPASVGLIAAAGLSVIKLSLINTSLWQTTGKFIDLFKFREIILAVLIFVLIRKFKGHPLYYIAGSAVVGIVFHLSA